MRAMVLERPSSIDNGPLHAVDRPVPPPPVDGVLVRVDKVGVCRTDLHVVEGDLPARGPSIIPGHEVVGRIEQVGPSVQTLRVGQLVGVPWLHSTCGACEYCRSGRENLCDHKEFTGYSVDGGYAEYATGREGFVFPISTDDAASFAPLLCAGIIGYRALRLTGTPPGGRLGLFGIGGSAHLTLQLAERIGYATVAVSRSARHLALAQRLGAHEAVLSGTGPGPTLSAPLDGAIVFAPAGPVVLEALRSVKKGATVALAGIHMSPIPSIDYDRLLTGERRIVGVESNTRTDAREFLALAARHGIRGTVEVRPLEEANAALQDLKAGRVDGAFVLDCS